MKQPILRATWLLLFFGILLILSSCVSQKKIKYLQAQIKIDTSNLYRNKRPLDYKVQPNDNLYIKVASLDNQSASSFNQLYGSGTQDASSDISLYLNSYTVDKQGNIEFPIVGKVFVKDLTLDQIKEFLQIRINEFLKNTIIIVKMVNFNVTILGEVHMPGQIKIYQDEVTLFEAIAMAGDLTDFANRNKIALIRQTPEGSRIHYIDLTKAKILSSEYYYLMPNDVIYAAPLGIKQWGFAVFPYALVFTMISTALLLINYFK